MKIEKKEEIVELTAFFEYEDWKKEKKLDVRILVKESEEFLVSLEKQLKEQEASTRKSKEFYTKLHFPRQGRRLGRC